MGWIVKDACDRLWGEIGRYHWDEWCEVASTLGLEVVIVNQGPVPPACLIGRTIYVRGGLCDQMTARLVFHEVGHAVLHAGTPQDWRAMPGGTHVLHKFERQAEEFAALFPVWD